MPSSRRGSNSHPLRIRTSRSMTQSSTGTRCTAIGGTITHWWQNGSVKTPVPPTWTRNSVDRSTTTCRKRTLSMETVSLIKKPLRIMSNKTVKTLMRLAKLPFQLKRITASIRRILKESILVPRPQTATDYAISCLSIVWVQQKTVLFSPTIWLREWKSKRRSTQ